MVVKLDDTRRRQLTIEVLKDIDEHRDIQLGVYGYQENSPEKWYMIASTEMGEIGDAIQKAYRSKDGFEWEHIYEETIQTLGVLTAFAESIKSKQPSVRMPDYNIEQMRKDRGLD